MPTPSLRATSTDQAASARLAHEGDQERLILIPLEARALQLVALVMVLGATAWMATTILRPAVADWLASGAVDSVALERAVAWQPGHPDLHLRLARAYDTASEAGTSIQAGRHLATALRQRPTSGTTWLQLALLADRRGDRDRARLALHTALGLDPHDVNLRWEAALLALRWDERDAAVEHLRYLLTVDAAQCDQAFQVASAILDTRGAAGDLAAIRG